MYKPQFTEVKWPWRECRSLWCLGTKRSLTWFLPTYLLPLPCELGRMLSRVNSYTLGLCDRKKKIFKQRQVRHIFFVLIRANINLAFITMYEALNILCERHKKKVSLHFFNVSLHQYVITSLITPKICKALGYFQPFFFLLKTISMKTLISWIGEFSHKIKGCSTPC